MIISVYLFSDLQFQYSANTCLDLTAARVVDVNADDLPHLFGNGMFICTDNGYLFTHNM